MASNPEFEHGGDPMSTSESDQDFEPAETESEDLNEEETQDLLDRLMPGGWTDDAEDEEDGTKSSFLQHFYETYTNLPLT